MKLDKVVEGKHNKELFRFKDGKLQMFGRTWDKADIQTLIEVANLLSIEGYILKIPVSMEKIQLQSPFGGTYEIDKKVYDENE